VNTADPTPTQTRAAAINELFAALDNLLRSYRSVPDDEREDRLAVDADLITGEIARRLAVARAAMSNTFADPA
jgi:chromosome condensin MukBEF MukE localization factor